MDEEEYGMMGMDAADADEAELQFEEPEKGITEAQRERKSLGVNSNQLR